MMSILDTRENLNAMVLNHEQQIKDIAAHLLELKQLVTTMMEFKRREWVGLTEDESFVCRGRDYFETYKAIETKLKEKNT